MKSFRSLRVLCTGAGGPSGYACLQALTQVGHEVKLFAADCNDLAVGFTLPDVTRVTVPNAAKCPEEFIRELLTFCLQNRIDVIFAAPEPEVELLSRVKKEWRNLYQIDVAVSDPETTLLGVDKYELYKNMSNEYPIKIGGFREVTDKNDLLNWSHGFPCVLKPKRGSNSKGVFVVNNFDELQICYEFLRVMSKTESMLVHEYIPGHVQSTFTVGSLFWDGEPVAASIHQKLRTAESFGGSTVAARLSDRSDLIESSLECLKKLGKWHGFVAVETKICAETNLPYLLEINPRLWGFADLAKVAGINFPDLYLEKLNGKEIPLITLSGCKDPRALTMIRSLDLSTHA